MARVDDAVSLCDRRHTPYFLGFLDERQVMLVRPHIARHRVSYTFYGGHEEAERVILGIFPDGDDPVCEWFPISVAAFHYGMPPQELTHRDVLGALLGCGITREKIGDILCSADRAVVFLHGDIASYVVDSVQKIGRVGVKPECPYEGELPTFRRFECLSGTVAAPRLDAVLKVLLGVSRERACALLREDAVQLDHTAVTSPSRTVKAEQILSVRGYGRFVVDDISQMTKKGRLVVQARRYV